MRRLFLLLSFLVAVVVPAAAAALKPPPTPIVNVSTTYWGVAVDDPYRWLENASTPKVSAWIDAQNSYAADVFAAFKHADAIGQRLRELAITGPQWSNPKIAASMLFYLRETPPAAQPVLVGAPWPSGAARVLVDPNPAGGLLSIEGYWPSPDGKYVAYATQEAGAEVTSMHVVRVADAVILPDTLTDVSSGASTDALAWDADSLGFVYTRVPRPTGASNASYFDSTLYHHRLGAAASADQPALGQGLSPVAEWNATESEDGRAVAMVHYGDGSYSDMYERVGAGPWRKVVDASTGLLVGEDETTVTTAAFVGPALLAIETTNAPRGEIVAVSGGAGAPGRVLVGEPAGGWAIRAIGSLRGGFLTTEVNGADWRVRQFDVSGRFVRTVALPARGIGIDGIAADASSDQAVIQYSGWVIPDHWARYDTKSGALTTIYALKPPADYSDVEFTTMDAISKDGTRVPMTVIHRRGMAANSSAPGILTAYGGYGLTQSPFFIGTALFWIEHGGVYAQAYIRGGGEHGETWHLDGRLTKKQNDYDDFAACSRALLSSGWVAPGRLGIVGGSNGGLLMGAALTQHPDLYRAVVSFAGDYDMLRVEDSPNGRYNVTEFGTVKDEAQFKALYAYSPYANVRAGTAYPAVLMIAGENDPRVEPWQSRKMIARLQAANNGPAPIMLITRRQAGHGIGASFSQRLGDRSAEYVFFANELGLRF
jgi:prolyl oligopeptidase